MNQELRVTRSDRMPSTSSGSGAAPCAVERDNPPLPAAESGFHTIIFNHAIELIGMVSLDGALLAANRAALELINRREEELLGKPFWELPWWSHSPELQQQLRDAIRQATAGKTVRFEATHPDATGELHQIDFSISPVTDETGRVLYLVPEGRDITGRKRAEEQVRRLNRLYAVASGINEAIVRLRDPQQLYAEACRIAVEKGQIRMAWLGLVNEAKGRIIPITSAGHGTEYLTGLEISIHDNVPLGIGPAGRAYRSGQHAVSNDIANDVNFATRAAAVERGYRSCAAFPLRVASRTIGILVMYAGQPSFFNETELQLLNALAENISFALDFAERERQRQCAVEALQSSEERFRLMVENATDIVSEVRHDGYFLYVSPNIESVLGYKPGELIGTSIFLHVHQEDLSLVQPQFMQPEGSATYRYRHRDGSWRWLETSGRYFSTGGGEARAVLVTRDITSRKDAENALRATEEQFRRLIETSPLAMAVTRNESEIIYLNPKFTDLFGYSYTDIPTVHAWWPLAYPDAKYRERVKADWLARIEEGTRNQTGIRPMEAVVQRKDGQRRHVEFQTSIIGERTMVVFFDLTERKAAELALRESEERFSKAFRASPDAMSISDLETSRYIEVNGVHERLFGFKREEVIGRTPGELGILENDSDRDLFVSELKKHGVVRGFELRARTRGGRPLIVQISAEITQVGGKECVLRVTRDVTERRAAEEALRESQRALATLLGNLDGMAYRCRNDKDWTMEFVSGGCRMLTGYPPEALMSQHSITYEEITHPEDRDRVRQVIEDSLAKGRRFDVEYRIVAADRAIKRVWERGVGVFAPDGSLLFIEGFITDVTEARQAEEARRAMENQLRQTQKLEAIGTLAGGIAHDFNNILGAILAYTELARLESQANPDLQDYLAQVVKASQRAADLVRQILSFSRQQVQERRPMRAAPIIREALKLLRPALPSTIEIITAINENAPEILADASQIHQVMMNLCTNAAHSMQDGPGCLTVTLERGEVDAALAARHVELRQGTYARLTVADTGHGMEPAVLKRIFEPFFTTKAPGTGTGLGLSVVHGIVRDHEGTIIAESTPGRGTSISVYLPALETEVPDAREESDVLPRGQRQRVLFVDDERSLCDVANRLLTRLGYEPVVCQGALEALERFESDPAGVDVVITDLTMPGMTGVDLARRFLTRRPNLPVILTSGFSSTWTVERLRSIGLCDLIAKPTTPRDLAYALQRALQTGAPPVHQP